MPLSLTELIELVLADAERELSQEEAARQAGETVYPRLVQNFL
ncbi:MAG: hypothetical protein AB7S38_09530 [Vulcanimicrobiota bacterium]